MMMMMTAGDDGTQCDGDGDGDDTHDMSLSPNPAGKHRREICVTLVLFLWFFSEAAGRWFCNRNLSSWVMRAQPASGGEVGKVLK